MDQWSWGFARLARLGVFSGLLLLVAVMRPAQADDHDRLEAFLNVTGFDVALDSIALMASDAPDMVGIRAEEFGYRWKEVTEEVFDRARMRGMALEILAGTLDDDLLHHAVEFYATPLGQRLVEAENRVHMEEDDTAKREEGARIVAALREEGSPRIGYFERMNAAIDASDSAVRAILEIQFRFLMAASESGVIDGPLDAGALRALLWENEDEMRDRMAASTLANSAYAYRDFSDEDIRAYTRALEAPPMQRVYELMNAIQWEIMANRFEALAIALGTLDRGEEL